MICVLYIELFLKSIYNEMSENNDEIDVNNVNIDLSVVEGCHINLQEKIEQLQERNRRLESEIEDLKIEKISYMELLDMNHEESDTDYENLEDFPSDIRREIESDLEKENQIVDLGVKISRLQYEISEYFHMIRQNISIEQNDYERYKVEKRNFYKMIEVFHEIYKGENKLDVFELLIKILRKQKRVYECDQEMNLLL